MKKRIFGRIAGSQERMALLFESGGVCTGGQRIDPSVVDEVALASARKQVQLLRAKNIEGYVVFENDPTRYEFSPEADFVYPAVIQ